MGVATVKRQTSLGSQEGLVGAGGADVPSARRGSGVGLCGPVTSLFLEVLSGHCAVGPQRGFCKSRKEGDGLSSALAKKS